MNSEEFVTSGFWFLRVPRRHGCRLMWNKPSGSFRIVTRGGRGEAPAARSGPARRLSWSMIGRTTPGFPEDLSGGCLDQLVRTGGRRCGAVVAVVKDPFGVREREIVAVPVRLAMVVPVHLLRGRDL